MSWGKMFISAVLAEGSVSGLLKFGKIEHLFRGTEVEPYEFVVSFVKEYGKLPAPETILAHTGEELVAHKEPSAYYYDCLSLRHTELEIRSAMKKQQEFLAVDAKDPEAALKVMVDTAMGLMSQRHARQVVDFREAYDMVLGNYMAKKHAKESHGLRLGWPYLDTMSGGLVKGDMVSFVGRPAAGKTWQLLYGAHHGWAKAALSHNPEYDQSRMFVSMEMDVLPIQERLAALHTHMSMDNVKLGKLGTQGLIKLRDGLIEIKGYGAPFYVVDGNLTATVEDIYMLARQLKPAAIFVDGAYLVKHPTERDRYRRVAENAELIKKELASLAPVACSWQFAKSASKKNKKAGEKPDIDDIGSSVAIGQVSSIVLGIFEEENVETLKQRRVEVLKGRSGEVGEFRTRWDFAQMNFNEIDEETGGENAEGQETSHENPH